MVLRRGRLCFFLVIFLVIKVVCSTRKLQEQFSWKILDYAFPSERVRIETIRNQQFIPENNLPVGIEIWKNKLFVTVPRWRTGIPSTLNYIPITSPSESPPLIPYPNWSSNELGNCQFGLNTVYRIKADACDRLWVLDTGTFGIGNTTQNLCPYALNIFDLNTNRRLRRYELRTQDTNANTFIANIAVDLGRTCDDAFAYMSDELGYGLIAYSWKENRSWRFSHGYFMPDPLAGDFNIAGLNFQWSEEGIFGIALSPAQRDGTKILYFSPLASNRQFAVSTRILRNSSKIEDSYHDFVALDERGPAGQTTAKVIDDNGIEFFNLINRNSIGCWNTNRPHNVQNIGIVDSDNTTLIFPSDVKVDEYGQVWAMSDRMSTFLLSNLNYNDVNFRVFFAPSKFLISGTVCDQSQSFSNNNNNNNNNHQRYLSHMNFPFKSYVFKK